MTTFNPGWYLLYTKPRHERKIAGRLSEKQLNFLLPTRKIVRVLHDRKKYIEEVLFPSYIFIQLNDINDYYEGLGIDGVLWYIRSGKEVVKVHEQIIDNIRMTVDGGNELEVTGDEFCVGQKLLIQQGPLKGLSCEIVEYNGKKRLLVRVTLLKRNILVALSSEQLQNV